MISLMQGDCLERMKEIPNGSVDLVLIDPPYVGMVNEKWDRLTDTEASSFYKNLLTETQRVLRFGGRLISFSSNDTLKWLHRGGLKHRELLVATKDCSSVAAGRNTRQYKQHVNHVEYIFVATKYARYHTKSLLLKAGGGLKAKEINKMLGVATNGGGMWSIYTGNNICEQVPTQKQWNKFEKAFPELPAYNTFEEIFNNNMGMGNVLNNFNFRIKNRVHPTQKPLPLVDYLIKTYTNKGDIVLDSCMGSGTTGVAAKNLGRNFIGIELDKEYFKIAEKRINENL